MSFTSCHPFFVLSSILSLAPSERKTAFHYPINSFDIDWLKDEIFIVYNGELSITALNFKGLVGSYRANRRIMKHDGRVRGYLTRIEDSGFGTR